MRSELAGNYKLKEEEVVVSQAMAELQGLVNYYETKDVNVFDTYAFRLNFNNIGLVYQAW